MQLRILVLVFMFLGVLLLMSEARKPENWRWMWQFDDQPSRTEQLGGGESSSGTPVEAPGDQNAAERAADDQSAGDQMQLSEDPAAAPPSDGWEFVLRRLSAEQRRTLLRGRWLWRRDQPFSVDDRRAWEDLLKQLDTAWNDYCERGTESLAPPVTQLSEEERRAIKRRISACQDTWKRQFAVLAELPDKEPLSEMQRAVFGNLEKLWDRQAWAEVEDNTVLRNAETTAWYRCWDRLQTLSAAELDQAQGPLNYVQLFSQPQALRGELVRVSGVARSAHRIVSQEPRLGVEGYFLLGLQPKEGSQSPIVVYCTTLPDDFPPVPLPDKQGRGAKLREPVEVTGYYFKRWLHSSGEGMTLSPLILGRITQWTPAVAQPTNETATGPSAWLLWSGSTAMALLAAIIAYAVFRATGWSRAAESGPAGGGGELPSFDTGEVRGERLPIAPVDGD